MTDLRTVKTVALIGWQGVRIKITIFFAGDADTASTRLRAMPIAELATMQVDSVDCDAAAKKISPEVDILWFQKRLEPGDIPLAKHHRKRGGLVVYDCDDSGPALSYWAGPELLFEMFHAADLIFVDTPERRKWVRKSLTASPIHVLENSYDYGFPKIDPIQHRLDGPSEPDIRVLWYGNDANLYSIQEFSHLLAKMRGVRFVLCGSTPEEVARVFPDFDFETHSWRLDTFLSVLKTCDLCVLSHLGSSHDQMKSAHKMITAICHGIPVIASDTPDYRRIACLIDALDSLYDSPDQFVKAIETYRYSQKRSAYLQKARPLLLDRYSPENFKANVILYINRTVQRHIVLSSRLPAVKMLAEILKKISIAILYKFYFRIWKKLARI